MIASTNSIKKAQKAREKIKSELTSFKLEEFLFAEQLKFVTDPSPNKIAICSRRSGKSISCAADLIYTAITNTEVVCLYVTLSRNNAKKIIWRELKKINRVYKLGGEENLSELSMTFPNNSIIYLSGAKDTNEIEKFRGLALKLVYIDEAQSFREYLKDLINDILSPALMDYAGTLCLIGTPGPTPTGFFYDAASESSRWSKHSWTFWQNPFIVTKSKKTHQQMLDRELERRGVLSNDPSIQREWFGRWVLDSDSLILHYDQPKNHFLELPALKGNEKYTYVMGIDLGFNDADAIAILAYNNENSANCYLVDELVTPKQGITELTQQIEKMIKTYDPSKIVMDEGGLGKKMAEEMRRQKSLPIHPADKKRKMENLAFLDDNLRTGRFRAKSTSRFAQDTYLVEKDLDKSTPDKIVVSSRYHSDIIDAVLYAAKECPNFAYIPPTIKPKPGTDAYHREQEKVMYERELEGAIAEKQSQEGWSIDDYDPTR